jgi:uncharacterized protein YjaG (DUF416 family)
VDEAKLEPPVGAALSRDISRSNWDADAEIDRFIERRSRTLRRENQQQAEEAAWAESTRKANAAIEAELREQWSSWHLGQAARHRAVLEDLAAHHEQRAEELMGGGDAA